MSGFSIGAIDWHPALAPYAQFAARTLFRAMAINEWLKASPLAVPVPLRERSMEIFGREKYLDSWKGGLFSGRAPLSLIYAYWPGMPVPRIAGPARGRPILVVENHQAYETFARWNSRAGRWSAVCFGMGCAVEAMPMALLDACMECGAQGRVEYFGDIDPAGFRIMRELSLSCEELGMDVYPLLPAYEWLMKNGIPNASGGRPGSHSWLALEMIPAMAAEISDLWDRGLRIAQECLGYGRLAAGALR